MADEEKRIRDMIREQVKQRRLMKTIDNTKSGIQILPTTHSVVPKISDLSNIESKK